MHPPVLKIRLQLSDVVVRVGLIWLVLIKRPRAVHRLVVRRHLGPRNGDGADGCGGRGGDVQRLNPADSGIRRSVLSVAGIAQTRGAHGGRELRPAARFGVESWGALALVHVGIVAGGRGCLRARWVGWVRVGFAVVGEVRRNALGSVLMDRGWLVVQVGVWTRGLGDALGFGMRHVHRLQGRVLRWWRRRRQQRFLHGGGQHGGGQESLIIGVVDGVRVVGVHGGGNFALQRSHGRDRRREAVGGVSGDGLGAQVQWGSPRGLPRFLQMALVARGHGRRAAGGRTVFRDENRRGLRWLFGCSCAPYL